MPHYKGGFAKTRGETHWDHKLTIEQVLEIRAAHGSLAKIARRFGVSPAAVGKIKRRESWSWLTNEGTVAQQAAREIKPDGRAELAARAAPPAPSTPPPTEYDPLLPDGQPNRSAQSGGGG